MLIDLLLERRQLAHDGLFVLVWKKVLENVFLLPFNEKSPQFLLQLEGLSLAFRDQCSGSGL